MSKMTTKNLVLSAILTALVWVLQTYIRIPAGMFAINLVLVPIAIGAATCGAGIGAWLGLVSGIAVLASGDANAFLAVNVIGTIITVLVKGTLCGLLAGLLYNALKKVNHTLAVVLSAIACPIVNTGVFVLGCLLFFMETITEWAGGANGVQFIFVGIIGLNFFVEVGVNLVLSPVIVRLINIRKKK